MSDFLLEIGTEELPAGIVSPGAAQLRERLAALLQEARLGFGEVKAWGTPRRLGVWAHDVAARQEELRRWVRGPSVRIAFDESGRPTRAALGFARTQGVSLESLEVRETTDGAYVGCERIEGGVPAADVLRELVPQLLAGLEFARTMRWGDSDVRFPRPIRWILALLGSEPLRIQYAGLEAGRVTFGHRFLAPGPVLVPEPSAYGRLLAEAYVIADVRERAALIREQVEDVGREVGGRVIVEEDLLEEVTQLVEYPTAFAGRFSTEYLDLPKPVLVTTMRVHQRYFPVEEQGSTRLLPVFVAVRNGGAEHLETVRRGNERVLAARLADARFFYDEDRRQPLEAFLPKLERMTFQARLGTIAEKSARVRDLARWLAERMGLGSEEASDLDRAALLSKADLVTALVYEFPELEGTMGGVYARQSGEREPVASAIEEHVLPRAPGDDLPRTRLGALLALADRADTVAGCFAAELQPAGSHDPFAVRRRTLAILALLRTAADRVDLEELMVQALARQPERLVSGREQELLREILEFFRARLKVQLTEAGFAPEFAEAALSMGIGDVPGVWWRVQALAELVHHSALEGVLTVYRRSAHLAGRGTSDHLLPEMFADPSEAELFEALLAAEAEAEAALEQGKAEAFFTVVAALRPRVDAFLDAVLVMSPDLALRENRLALLRRVSALACRLGDLAAMEGLARRA